MGVREPAHGPAERVQPPAPVAVVLAHGRPQFLVQEVDQAISGYNAEQSRLASLSRARSASLDAVKLASERYERGLTDFLNVLDAERQQFELEAQYVISRRRAGVQLVALYKALGGGWEHYQAVPPIRTPEPAIAAAARELNGLRPVSTDPGLSQFQP